MALGIRKNIASFYRYFIYLLFNLKRFLFGFENANLMLSRVDKKTALLILRKYGAAIGDNCDIETPLYFHNCSDYRNLIIGNNCHVGKNCFFDLRDKVVLKDNVVISMNNTFITHISMKQSLLSLKYPNESKPVIINKNTYIGEGSTILMGVEIGKNSFIAAKSLITKSFPDNCMLIGNPARIFRKITI